MTTQAGVFRTWVAQAGWLCALRLAALKLLRKALAPGSHFHYGMTGEDQILLFMVDKYIGRRQIVYVDVGCHEPRAISNSYLLYLQGASGLAIDLDPRYEAGFRRHRPRDVFLCAAVSDGEREVEVHEFDASAVNTIDASQAEVWKENFTFARTRRTRTVCLTTLVERQLGERGIDVLMMDVEGHELAVLAGADLAHWRPALVVCELHGLALARAHEHPVVQFLATAGYRLDAYATVNAYFVRRDLGADADVR